MLSEEAHLSLCGRARHPKSLRFCPQIFRWTFTKAPPSTSNGRTTKQPTTTSPCQNNRLTYLRAASPEGSSWPCPDDQVWFQVHHLLPFILAFLAAAAEISGDPLWRMRAPLLHRAPSASPTFHRCAGDLETVAGNSNQAIFCPVDSQSATTSPLSMGTPMK